MMMENRNFKLQTLLSILMAAAMMIGTIETASGQYAMKQADAQAGLYNYARAVPLYEKAYGKKTTSEAARGLAESYRLMNNYTAAEPWYAKLVAMPDHTPADELHYAGILMSNSKYAEAKQVLDSFLSKDASHTIAANMRKGCDSASKWQPAPVKGALENMQELNSSWSDWSTAFHNGTIVFASDRPYDTRYQKSNPGRSGINKKYYGWTGYNYLHLYESNGLDSAAAKMLGSNINGDYHSASVSYSNNGKFYYAVTGLLKDRSSFLGKDGPYTLNVMIVEQQWDANNSTWRQSALFPYNGIFEYSLGDPYITPDGSTIYFVSTKGDNNMGGTDIFYSTLDENGKWRIPVNMGPEINTAGNERTPIFAKDGTFYFASDGRPGMGALDIYKAVKTGNDGSWQVTNMRSPVNSAQDDFAPSFDSTVLYFSSNRTGGKGSDDIYRFIAFKVLEFSLSGKVQDLQTAVRLPGAEVTLHNKQTGASEKAVTDENGNYHFTLDSLSNYELSVAKTGFTAVTGVNITTNGLTESTALLRDITMEMPPPPKPVEPKKEIRFGQMTILVNQPIEMKGIRFGVNKADITPSAAAELNNLVKLLKDNPTLKIELSSHTDARGNDGYNMKLSQRRAESTLRYLVSKGIDRKRLVAKGYGESQLLNRCANNVPCTEEEHSINRRTAFTILDK
jgi:peptidoglycan-associated lipoprotein